MFYHTYNKRQDNLNASLLIVLIAGIPENCKRIHTRR